MIADRSTKDSVASAADSAPTLTPANAPVVLYDGLCGLCDRYVQFVLRRDRSRGFRFAPLQGRFAAVVLARHGIAATDNPRSMALVESPGLPGEKVRLRSDAVLAVLAGLGGAWRLAVLLRLFPRPVRDLIYDGVARVRYRVFGRLDSCAVPPTSAGPDRFLD